MRMAELLAREVAAAGLTVADRPGPVVTEEELEALPGPARRYLRFMGVVGRARDTSFFAQLRGRFRVGWDAPWKKVEAWQFNAAPPDVARLFYMRLPFVGVPVLGRDTYLRGKGRLLVRALDLVTVQDGQGPELDLGELVTWLDDAVLLAPTMLLSPQATWSEVDDNAFDLAFADCGHTVRARVLVDARGAPLDVTTRDRWYAPPGRAPIQTPWSTPVAGWQAVDGRMLPTEGEATWKTEAGDLTYAELRFRPGDVVHGIAPGALPPALVRRRQRVEGEALRP